MKMAGDVRTRESVAQPAAAQPPANVARESTTAHVTGEATPANVPAAKAAGVAAASTAAGHRYCRSAAERCDRRERDHYFPHHNVFSVEFGPGARPGTLDDFTTVGPSARGRSR
jgi:hypothetical protein